jgi:glycosyltransferase involved in cell wall biosynthesis
MITIITPVHNGARFIQGCIENVIHQQCPDMEHIIIDGGSTDGTPDIIRRYAEAHPHIRWISERDSGQADAMNKGLAMAKGEIVGFLNVDDYYEKGVLNRIKEIFEKLASPSLVVGNCNVWDDEGRLLMLVKPSRLKLHQLLLGPVINLFPVNPSEYFYHKALHENIGPYNNEDHYTLDLDFLLRAVQEAHVVYFNETWGNYRLIEGTKTFEDRLSRQNEKRCDSVLKFYRKYLPWYFRKTFWFYKTVQGSLFWMGYLINPGNVIRGIKTRIKSKSIL